ncbi:CKLF-like MARVEL transmembrane domain-containing protein 3 isoform X2 [Amblyraja radiata]|uniref:CKLF-like MARVEL transmembrane domain-containing protein 3 isoform X2 n=1 Tax=Amblyraja radiata TaxID=386614 RepID=UPI00140256B6|nr:CKLF-like MARVEL transmembrane domain-containing protein 3 isoform X2 [Amblyraja radiata]
MSECESPEPSPQSQPGLGALIADRAFLTSRKGLLLAAEVLLSFIIFICYLASSVVFLFTAPLIEFLLALTAYYLYVTKFVERFNGFHCPLIIFGFVATVVFAFDFYGIFNQLVIFINPQELPTHTATIRKTTGEDAVPSDSDSE